MTEPTQRGIREGLAYGLLAGILFAVALILAAVFVGNPAVTPFRLFTSVLLGQSALVNVPAGTALVVGGVVHLVLSSVFGMLYDY